VLDKSRRDKGSKKDGLKKFESGSRIVFFTLGGIKKLADLYLMFFGG